MLVGGGAIAPEWRRSSVATRAYPIGAAHAMTSTVSRRQGCALRSFTRAVPALAEGRRGRGSVPGGGGAWFMGGGMPGAPFRRRGRTRLGRAGRRWTGRPGRRLNAFPVDAAAGGRAVFPGPGTYAAAPIERVD